MENSSRNIPLRLDISFCSNLNGNINNPDMQKMVSSTEGFIHRSSKKSRRFRSSFTTDQINYLEKEFKKFPYIGNVNRQELSKVLNLPERAIKIWFQNRRMREKKDAFKEFNNIEDHNSITKNANNNQLNNAHHLQSPNNDHFQIKTPLQIGSNEAKYVGIPIEVKTGISTNKPANNVTKDSREQEISTTTETLGKQSPNENLKASLEPSLNTQPEKCVQKVTFKKENKLVQEDSTHAKAQYPPQDLPEDLSQCKTSTVSTMGKLEKDSVPIYIPNCYAQQFSPSNVLWSPNLSTLIPGGNTLPYPGTYAVFNPQPLRKKNCNCDCHSLQQQLSENQAQFLPVFTVPYTPHL